MDNATPFMTQTIEGFYDPYDLGLPMGAARTVAGKITHIVGSGQLNKTDRVVIGVPPQIIETDVFTASAGLSWDNYTKEADFTLLDDALTETGYSLITTIDSGGSSNFDCLTWGAIIYRVRVNDGDDDGLLDMWEFDLPVGSPLSGSGNLEDPIGRLLPDLAAMGAVDPQKDLFVEIGAMQAVFPPPPSAPLPTGTTYGPLTDVAGVDTWVPPLCEEDTFGHNHTPSPAVLKIVADAYWCGGANPCNLLTEPNANPNGIYVHFDMGDSYFNPAYAGADAYAERYIIRDTLTEDLARGGELITEAYCVPDHDGDGGAETPEIYCQFPDHAGVVSWKTGFQLYRDAPVKGTADGMGMAGDELSFADQETQQAACLAQPDPDADVCRIRFERPQGYVPLRSVRPHAGKANACLDGGGSPTGWGDEAARTCAVAFNPEFNRPTSASGAGDLPGGDFLVTLGRWGFDFLGSEFVQASTTAHEDGHNLWLFHGGGPPVPASPIPPEEAAQVRLNCKPHYLSVMSYLYGPAPVWWTG